MNPLSTVAGNDTGAKSTQRIKVRVQFVNAFPDSCGKWQLVDSFPGK